MSTKSNATTQAGAIVQPVGKSAKAQATSGDGAAKAPSRARARATEKRRHDRATTRAAQIEAIAREVLYTSLPLTKIAAAHDISLRKLYMLFDESPALAQARDARARAAEGAQTEQLRKAEQGLRAGRELSEIAKACDVALSTLRLWIASVPELKAADIEGAPKRKKNRVSSRNNAAMAQAREHAEKRFLEGASRQAVADECGVHRRTVDRWVATNSQLRAAVVASGQNRVASTPA
ncbi:helix-turn-helix domain-containing protein [Burkholderia vietnamiensis]|uniref:Uncharacterized protein n=1 Tax=Burkholderia vietnamiensis (strain G4 / LMG 22486) TaxID=269482 RepID=A4JFM1_BURVG|nr:hypothetical protein Bcep1808_2072 [Burkholderia vietnamiensis G4]MCB4344835.1 helix-turn-helix domain-containing protein [Burkholderia vietnamiensis]